MLTDTTLTSEFECFDIEQLKKIGTSSTSGSGKITYTYTEYYPSGLFKCHISGGEYGGYTQRISLDTVNYLSLYKSFYSNGKIKKKGITCDLGFDVGTWYTFSEIGGFKEEEKNLEGFTFTFDQLREAVKKEGLSLDNLPALKDKTWLEYPVGVYTGHLENNNNRPSWGIEYEDPENREDGIWGTEIYLRYDGITGELLKKEYTAINP